MSHAKAVVVTFSDFEIAGQLAPIVLERHSDLTLMVSVCNDQDKEMFAVVEQSFPKGLDMAAAVLSQHKINKWMKLQQNKRLEDNLPSQASAPEAVQ